MLFEIDVFLCQGEAAGTDPKTTALTTLGLAMGAKNLRTLTRYK